MAHHIKPASITAYLLGICNSLEPYFPNVQQARHSLIVTKSLAGMHKLRGSRPITCKRALTEDDLRALPLQFSNPSHDDRLFLAMVFTGFNGLLRAGEMTRSSNPAKHSSKKTTMRHTVLVQATQYSFHLPYHKGDRLYHGNKIVIRSRNETSILPLAHFRVYLASRDLRYPFHPELWLTELGVVPSYPWFVARLQTAFGSEVAGHSLHAGGATALALAGVCMGIWLCHYDIKVMDRLSIIFGLFHFCDLQF
jgi:hypothetical protein